MSRGDAKDMLVHYMGEAWKRAGLKWDSDNVSEVGGVVDSIAEAVKDEVHDEFLAADRATDRFDAALAALAGYRSNPTIDQTDSDLDALIIEWSVRDADALLAALAKK